MINNSQNTNFGMNIAFKPLGVDDLQILAMRRVGKSVESPWTLKESRFLRDECYTNDIKSCTAGVMKVIGGDEFYMFHLDPEEEANDWSKVSQGLVDVQTKLREGNSKAGLEGFLIGATSSIFDEASRISVKLANNLEGFFKETGVRFSSFLVQGDSGVTQIYYSLPTNQMTVCARRGKLFGFSEQNVGELFSSRNINENDNISYRT